MLQYWHAVLQGHSSSSSPPPRPLRQLCVAMGSAEPHRGARERRGQRLTSTGDLSERMPERTSEDMSERVGPLVARAGRAQSRAGLAQGFLFIPSMHSREAAEGWG